MKRKWIKMTVRLVWITLLLAACQSAPEITEKGTRSFGSQQARVEEISFQSGKFRLVGDLWLPDAEGPYPAIIMVHGSGSATRNGAVQFSPLIEIFLSNGFAVFSWDKPGSGSSTGEFNNELSQRAEILADGVEVLAEHPSLDQDQIGLWGISQAGWVMPLAIEESERIAFMIVVSGGGEDSIEQLAYQFGQRVACAGGSQEQAQLVERSWSQKCKAESYGDYEEAMEVLLDFSALKNYMESEITEEKDWKPWPRHWDSFIDPMDVIEHTTIPMLVFFGELDKNIDPVQGPEAYQAALEKAGNQDYQIEVIPGVSHVLTPAGTGCLDEIWSSSYAPEFLEIMDTWLQELGY